MIRFEQLEKDRDTLSLQLGSTAAAKVLADAGESFTASGKYKTGFEKLQHEVESLTTAVIAKGLTPEVYVSKPAPVAKLAPAAPVTAKDEASPRARGYNAKAALQGSLGDRGVYLKSIGIEPKIAPKTPAADDEIDVNEAPSPVSSALGTFTCLVGEPSHVHRCSEFSHVTGLSDGWNQPKEKGAGK